MWRDEGAAQSLELPGGGAEPAVSDVDVLGCPGDDGSGSLDSCCAEA